MAIEYFPAITNISMEGIKGYIYNMIDYFPVGMPFDLVEGYYMKVEYFPVEFTTPEYKNENYKVSWYTKDSIIHHPRLLISYGHRPEVPLRQFVDDEKVIIMGDSGGFQAMTLGKEFDPNDVIKWQNDNCNIGMTLDYPPIESFKPDLIWAKGDKFTKYAEKSNTNANIMMGKKSQNLKLYLVVQGYNENTRQQWLDGGRKEYKEWEGYSLSPKPQSNPMVLADFLLFAKKNELKNIHLLGISGYNTIPIIVYMSKYFNSIYFDSSSYSMGSRQRIYNLPYSVNKKMSLASLKDNNGIPSILPCDCPVCSKIIDTKIFSNPDQSGLAGWLINMHNIVQTQRYLTFLQGIVHDKELFLSNCSDVVKDTVKYLDDRLEGKGQVTF